MVVMIWAFEITRDYYCTSDWVQIAGVLPIYHVHIELGAMFRTYLLVKLLYGWLSKLAI